MPGTRLKTGRVSKPIRGWLERGAKRSPLGKSRGLERRRAPGAGDLNRLDGQNGTQKAAGVLVDRVREQLGGGSLLDDLAGVHDRDVMGNLGDQSQVMRNEDRGEAELGLEIVQKLDDLLLDGHVQSGGGLVADDELGVAGQGHGDEHALALATGELVRIALERALGIEADELEEPSAERVPPRLVSCFIWVEMSIDGFREDRAS